MAPVRKSPKKRDITGSEAGRNPNDPVRKITLDKGPEASTRYTPRADHHEELPSPTWVPVLMFTLWGLGMLSILLNYVSLLPGAPNNWYLLLGLGFILGGIITATQYR